MLGRPGTVDIDDDDDAPGSSPPVPGDRPAGTIFLVKRGRSPGVARFSGQGPRARLERQVSSPLGWRRLRGRTTTTTTSTTTRKHQPRQTRTNILQCSEQQSQQIRASQDSQTRHLRPAAAGCQPGGVASSRRQSPPWGAGAAEQALNLDGSRWPSFPPSDSVFDQSDVPRSGRLPDKHARTHARTHTPRTTAQQRRLLRTRYLHPGTDCMLCCVPRQRSPLDNASVSGNPGPRAPAVPFGRIWPRRERGAERAQGRGVCCAPCCDPPVGAREVLLTGAASSANSPLPVCPCVPGLAAAVRGEEDRQGRRWTD